MDDEKGFPWILKAYNDGLTYEEEYIRGFPTKADAEAALKEMVEEEYRIPWDEIPEKKGFRETDVFRPDYVVINNGKDTDYFIVEKLEPGKRATSK